MSLAEDQKTYFEQFEQLVETEDKFQVKEFLDDQNISDVAELISEYPEHDTYIIGNMAIHRAAMVFKILDVTTQKDIIKQLPPSKTAELLNELPPDDRTDFLEELPRNTIRDLIKLLNPEERKVTLSMLGYPEDSVGRLMTPDYVYVYAHNTAAEVLATVRRYARGSETIDVLYVINEHGEFVDDIRIRDIILAEPTKRVDELIDGRVVVLNVNDDQEHASQVFKMNNRVALPVVDDNNILLGIVTIDDMLWVANEEFSEDIQMIGGTQAFEEPYLDIPLFKLFKKRVGWLIILFLGELLTASVMRYFEDEIAKVVFLASFVPLIISSGGNSGSQASTLIIQAMAVGEVTIADWWRVMRREIMSGLLLGSVLGIIGFVRIAIWNEFIPNIYGDVWVQVGLTVGTSLLGVVLWGTLTGSMLPLILKRFGADPAVSSAPFVATLVDVTGLVLYFSFAYLFLQGILL
jgi:magnesium transporter